MLNLLAALMPCTFRIKSVHLGGNPIIPSLAVRKNSRQGGVLLRLIRPISILWLITAGLVAYAEVTLQAPPPSPAPSEWAFVDALAAPLTWKPHWHRGQPKNSEINLKNGVRVETKFPNRDGLLDTAYNDLQAFFQATDIPAEGSYRIITEQVPTKQFETFKLIVTKNECRIQANDTEGIRRGYII